MSGTQKWKGTTAALKAKPTRVSATPAVASVASWGSAPVRPSLIPLKWRVPVTAYRKLDAEQGHGGGGDGGEEELQRRLGGAPAAAPQSDEREGGQRGDLEGDDEGDQVAGGGDQRGAGGGGQQQEPVLARGQPQFAYGGDGQQRGHEAPPPSTRNWSTSAKGSAE